MYVTSNLYDTVFNVKKIMYGGNSILQIMKEKRVFLFKVFLNLLVQLAITYYVMTNTFLPIPIWITALAIFVILIIIAFVPMPMYIKFFLFSIFSFLMGMLLSQGIKGVDSSAIQFALIGVACIFIAMLFAGIILLMLGIKLGYYTFMFLSFGLLFAILLSILRLFKAFAIHINQVGLSIGMIFLFSIYIIYNTQQILRRDYAGDFITASMDYYLDIINIFIRLLDLFD